MGSKYHETVKADFLVTKDVSVNLLKSNDPADKEPYLEVTFSGEHGSTRPKIMQAKSWRRYCENADSILDACDKVDNTMAEIRKAEAHLALQKEDFRKLNDARSAGFVSDEQYAIHAAGIKAKYPTLNVQTPEGVLKS